MIIYRYRNLINGKVYIGQTVKTVKRREELHRTSVKRGSTQAFHCAVRKYGWANFLVDILHFAKSIEELNAMETFFIILHQSHKPENGYNRNLGGYKRKNMGQVPWNKGLKGSQVAWNKGKKMSEEYREKCRRRSTPESAANARMGIKPHTPERNKRMSLRFLGEGNPFFGRKHSPESRLKMGIARKLVYDNNSPTVEPVCERYESASTIATR